MFWVQSIPGAASTIYHNKMKAGNESGKKRKNQMEESKGGQKKYLRRKGRRKK